MDTKHVKDFIRQPFAWPGGYPMFAICNDGGCLCRHCVKDNAKLIIRATRDDDSSGWNVPAIDVNWEDTSLYCDHCGELIESAYGEG